MSLEGYSPQGCKESDMTEATDHTCTTNTELKIYENQENLHTLLPQKKVLTV